MLSNTPLWSIERLVEEGYRTLNYSVTNEFLNTPTRFDRNSITHQKMIYILNIPTVVREMDIEDGCITVKVSQSDLPSTERSMFLTDGFYRFECSQFPK